MLFERVIVIRDQNTRISRGVPSWEVPVLRLVYDEGNVQQTGIFEKVDRPYPDVDVEMHRLTENYGSDKESKLPFAAIAYGSSSAGLSRLQDAIDEAEQEELKQIRAGTAPKVKLADVPAHIVAKDPLLA